MWAEVMMVRCLQQIVQNSDLQMCSLNKRQKVQTIQIQVSMRQFSREIKNSRLFCTLQPNRLQISLIDLDQDQLYQTQLQNNTLPQRVTQLASTIQDLYDFLENKVKYIKISAPGHLVCYKYTGTNQKYILLELERKILVRNDQTMKYIELLKQQIKKIHNLYKKNLKQIKGQKNTIQVMQAEMEKTQWKVRKSGRNKTRIIIKRGRQNYIQEEKVQVDYIQEEKVQVDYIQEEKVQVDDYGDKHQFELSKSCRFYNKFQINGNEVQKIISTDSYQLCSKQPLKKPKSYFTCLLQKLKYNNLIAGIITEDLLTNKESSYCGGCMCFDNYYGVVMNNGVQEPTHYTTLKEGQLLIVVVDMQQRRVEWKNRQQLLAYADLPPTIVACKLYPYFQLFDRHDCIVLNYQA